MILIISTQPAFDHALAAGQFAAAAYVWLCNLPGVATLPDMPAATEVWLDNLPGVTR